MKLSENDLKACQRRILLSRRSLGLDKKKKEGASYTEEDIAVCSPAGIE